jgi:hypothetical protein
MYFPLLDVFVIFLPELITMMNQYFYQVFGKEQQKKHRYLDDVVRDEY